MKLARVIAFAILGIACTPEEPFGEPTFICWFFSVDPDASHYPISISVDGKPLGTIEGTVGTNPDFFALRTENIQLLITDSKIIRAYFKAGTYQFTLQKSGDGGTSSWRLIKFPDDNNINLYIE